MRGRCAGGGGMWGLSVGWHGQRGSGGGGGGGRGRGMERGREGGWDIEEKAEEDEQDFNQQIKEFDSSQVSTQINNCNSRDKLLYGVICVLLMIILYLFFYKKK